MKAADESLWALIASAANEPEIEEIARLVGSRRIRDNDVSISGALQLPTYLI